MFIFKFLFIFTMRLVCWYCLQLVVFLQISCSSPSPEESKHNQKDTLIDKDLALKFFHDLGKRVHESVLWLGSIPRHLVRKAAVSHSDAHIVLHVYHFLNNTHHHMHTHEAGVHHFRNLLTHGHQCTPEQTKIQESILSHEDVLDICSEVEWYKLAHLAWPQATTIIDVGANRGYLGALFLGLWGGGGLKVAPRSIYDVALIDDLFTGTMQVQGYCEDGYDYAIPLFCSNHSRDVKTGICNEENLSISIHSVDGNSILAKTIQSVIAHNMTNESVRSGKVWKYHNYALSESEGTVGLTDYFEAPNGTLPVTTTVDLFMQSQHIESLDILKIDAGGSDMSVSLLYTYKYACILMYDHAISIICITISNMILHQFLVPHTSIDYNNTLQLT